MTAPAFLKSLPPWAADLVRSVRAKRANTFVLHGVPADLVPLRSGAGLRFLTLDQFLTDELFSNFQSIVTYNRAEGLGFASPAARAHSLARAQRHNRAPGATAARARRASPPPAARTHFLERLKSYDAVHGTTWADRMPRDAPNCCALLDSYFRHCTAQTPARPVVLLLPFAETMVPAGAAGHRPPAARTAPAGGR